MKDFKKSLPASEPPPHPLGGIDKINNDASDNYSARETESLNNIPGAEVLPSGVESYEQVDAKLQDVITNPIEPTTPPVVPEKPPKKGIPKIIFFFTFFFILVALIVVFIRLKNNGTPTFLGNRGEVVWWGIQHDVSVYQPLIDEFEKENPGINIRYERQSPQDYRLRLSSALSSGTGPDIFEIHNSWASMLSSELSVLPESIMTNEEFSRIFYPVIVSNLKLSKGVVGMPLEYDALTLYINEDVFTSALKSPPETWSDLHSLAIQLTQTGESGKILQGGVALGITENVDHWPEIFGLMLFQNGVNPVNPTGGLAADVFSFYKSFSKSKVWNNTLPGSTFAFSRGELAMYFGPSKRASEIVKANPNLKFRTVKLPQLPKNNPGDPNFSYATYWVHSVSEKSKVKEVSWTFLKYLVSEGSLKNLNDNIINSETFGRAYPRPEMNSGLIQDPIIGSVIALAYDAKSFYLADYTFDGPTGINSQVNNLYKNVIDVWSGGTKLLDALVLDLALVMRSFGINMR